MLFLEGRQEADSKKLESCVLMSTLLVFQHNVGISAARTAAWPHLPTQSRMLHHRLHQAIIERCLFAAKDTCLKACRSDRWKQENKTVTQDYPIWPSSPNLYRSYTLGNGKCLVVAQGPLGKNSFTDYLGFSEFLHLTQVTSCSYGNWSRQALLLVFLRRHSNPCHSCTLQNSRRKRAKK